MNVNVLCYFLGVLYIYYQIKIYFQKYIGLHSYLPYLYSKINNFSFVTKMNELLAA